MLEEAGHVYTGRNLMAWLARFCIPIGLAQHNIVFEFDMYSARGKGADMLIKDCRRSEGIVESNHILMLKPDLSEVPHRTQQWCRTARTEFGAREAKLFRDC